MKNKTNVILIVLFLSAFIILLLFGQQEAKWKGEIVIEDGVKIIKNPNEPLYGEIILELEEDLSIGREDDWNYLFYRVSDIAVDSQDNIYVADMGNCRIQKFDQNGKYLQTIGRKGQGPGEFQSPTKIFIDKNDNLYVKDQRKINKFNKNGKFLKKVPFQYPTFEIPIPGFSTFYFLVTQGGDVFAPVLVFSKSGVYNCIVRMNSEGKISKEIDRFLDKNIEIKGSTSGGTKGGVAHPYLPKLICSSSKGEKFIYGFSSEYKFFIIDKEGSKVLRILKEEKPVPLTREEKRKKMPSYRPFFSKIIADEKGRIWVERLKDISDESNEREIDIFGSDGRYLYHTKSPHSPEIIKKGYIYFIIFAEDSTEVSIKKYKIKNWDQIKEDI